MFCVNQEKIYNCFEKRVYPTNIYILFKGEPSPSGKRLFALTDDTMASVLKMSVEEYRTLLIEQFNAKTDDFETSFPNIHKADKAVEHLNVLYKLINAK